MEEPVLDQARQTKAREYSRLRRRLSFAMSAFSLIFLLVLIFTGVSQWFTGLFDWPVIAVALIYFLALMLVYGVLTAFVSFYRGFILPHRYGLSTQKLSGWLMDAVKGRVIGLLFSSVAVVTFYYILIEFPAIWWLLVWGLAEIVSIILSIVAPVILVPLFYKMKPLADENLKPRLEQLAEKAGARVNGIFVLDFSSKVTSANAALMGMGRTRRIVISDTLIQQYTTPEIEVITAHEIGHHMHRDIFRLFIFQAAASLLVLKLIDIIARSIAVPSGFSGIADPAGLPLLLLLFGILNTLISPLVNTYTRYVERQADEYALHLIGNPQAFISAMTRLVNQNLAVAYPAKWEEILFHDHPSYYRRVEHARMYQKNRE
jgi:STE24 endopeptidase